MDKPQHPYMMASQSDDEVTESSSAASLLHDEPQSRNYTSLRLKSRRTGLIWLLHAALLSTSAMFLITGILARRGDTGRCAGDWFPLLGHNPPVRTVRFDGSFDRSSPFKGPPSPAVDEAWDSILPIGGMRVPEGVFQTLNASTYAAEVPLIAGGGRLGLFEAIHQIHCVKSLWMATYPDYYVEEYRYSQEHPVQWREHMDHCADMLRQKLMCEADGAILTYNWIKKHYAPHPNFNVQHKCRNYDRLLEVAAEYKIDGSLFPKGYFVRPTDHPVVDFVEPPFDPTADS